MTLLEVFQQLLAGELSQMKIAETAAEDLTDAQAVKLAHHINSGLTTLYTRFNLKERKVEVPLVADADTYHLNLPDLLKVNKIQTDLELELTINKESDPYSVMTPALNYIRVPLDIVNKSSDLPCEELVTDNLVVFYRANHPKIDTSEGWVDAENITLELPETHLYALCCWVAHRMGTPQGAGQFEGWASQTHYAKFENECQRLEQAGMELDPESADGDDRLRRNGFV